MNRFTRHGRCLPRGQKTQGINPSDFALQLPPRPPMETTEREGGFLKKKLRKEQNNFI